MVLKDVWCFPRQQLSSWARVPLWQMKSSPSVLTCSSHLLSCVHHAIMALPRRTDTTFAAQVWPCAAEGLWQCLLHSKVSGTFMQRRELCAGEFDCGGSESKHIPCWQVWLGAGTHDDDLLGPACDCWLPCATLLSDKQPAKWWTTCTHRSMTTSAIA